MGTKAKRGVATGRYYGGGRQKTWSCTDEMTTVTVPKPLKEDMKAIAHLLDSGLISAQDVFDLVAQKAAAQAQPEV
jgi:hypothetical protein